MKKALEMLGKKKQEIQDELKKIDLDMSNREDGMKAVKKKREELVELLDSVDIALTKLQEK